MNNPLSLSEEKPMKISTYNLPLTDDDKTFIDRYPWIFKNASTAEQTILTEETAGRLYATAVSAHTATLNEKTTDGFIYLAEISTPMGLMLAGTTNKGVCLLEFTNRIRIEKEFTDLQKLLNAVMIPGRNNHTAQLEKELSAYFRAELKTFQVQLHTPGNEFSQAVWQTLLKIPYGTTCTYKEQAVQMNNPKAIRAIASTNGRNRLAIIVPCHRVIGSNGSMTGYAGGIDKKKWLLKFERENSAVPAGSLF